MSELQAYYEQIANRSRGKAGSSNLTGALGAQPGNTNTVAGGTNVKPVSSDLDGVSAFETKHGSVNTYSNSPENRSAKDGQELDEIALKQDKARLGNQSPDTNTGNAGLGPEVLR
jgi:hypothetical protein